MLERSETFYGEQYRRQDERRYADAYRLAKASHLLSSESRHIVRKMMTRFGKRLVRWGEQLQGVHQHNVSLFLSK